MLEKNGNNSASKAVSLFRGVCTAIAMFVSFSLVSGVSEAADYLNNPQIINMVNPAMSGDTVYISKDFNPGSANQNKYGINVESGFKGAQITNVSVDVQARDFDGIVISGDAAAVIKKSRANSAAGVDSGAGAAIFNNSSADISESAFQSAGDFENSAVAAVKNSFVKIVSSDVITDGPQRGHTGIYIGDKSSGEVAKNKITVIENAPSAPGNPDKAFGYGVHADKNSSLLLTGNSS